MRTETLPYRRMHRQYHVGHTARRSLSALSEIKPTHTTSECRSTILKVHPGLAKLSPDLWTSLVSCLKLVGGSKTSLASQIKTIELETLSATEWLRFSTLLIALKCFHEAHFAREYAKSRIRQLKRQLDSPLYCDLIIGLLIEDWELQELPKYLRYARALRTECGRNRASRFLANSLAGRGVRSPDNSDQEFQSLLDGRSVALVGPLELDRQDLDEIDQFDLVVGINDTSSLFSDKQESRSRRPDILYLAGSVQKRMEQHAARRLHHEPTVIVSKRNELSCLDAFRHSSFRQTPHYNHFVLNGSLNLLPRAALDLVLFKPARIKVFGADLYASISYRNDYGGIAHQSVETVLRQHVAHDLMTQYSILYNLFSYKGLEADRRLEPILNSGLQAYLDLFCCPDSRHVPAAPNSSEVSV